MTGIVTRLQLQECSSSVFSRRMPDRSQLGRRALWGMWTAARHAREEGQVQTQVPPRAAMWFASNVREVSREDLWPQAGDQSEGAAGGS